MIFEALGALAFLAVVTTAALLLSRRLPPSAVFPFLVLLSAAGFGCWSQRAADAHSATLDMLQEDIETQRAAQECLQKLHDGYSDLELVLCIADVASKARAAAEATRCQVEAVDALLDAVETEPVPDAGSSVPSDDTGGVGYEQGKQ
jgi:hypothetical protein